MNPLEILDGNKLIESIQFERIEVGTVIEKEYTLVNKSMWPVIKITITKHDEDLNIIHPNEMVGYGTSKIKIKWSPNISRRTPLTDEMVINGVELIG